MILASLLVAAAVGSAPWSPPTALPGACPASGPPRVVFPTNAPNHGTGPGAIVWDASPACPGGEGARVAAIGGDEQPGAPTTPHTAAGRILTPRGALAVSAGPHGQIVIAGASPGRHPHALMIQGRAGGPASSLLGEANPAAPLALASGYLGDVALASPPPTAHGTSLSPPPTASETGVPEGPAVNVERYFSNVLSRRTSASTSTGTATSPAMSTVTVALDYRSDALTLWTQAGALYARYLPARGANRPPQRLARVSAHTHVAALLSDNSRATVAWTEDDRGRTSVWVDRSAAGARFGAPRLLERVSDPDGTPSPPGSPSLVRLSDESVMLAWAGASSGHWVVRAAGVGAHGPGNASTIAAPGANALLAALAPGPSGEALALWAEPQPTAGAQPSTGLQALFSARGTITAAARTRFDAPEQVAPPEALADATVALDPDSDRAIAAWRGQDGELRYAVRGAFSATR